MSSLEGETQLKCHKNLVTSICVSDSEDYFYTSSRDRRIVKWCAEDLHPLKAFDTHSAVNSLCIRGPLIAAGCNSLVTIQSEELTKTPTKKEILAVTINHNASRIAFASADGTISVSNAYGEVIYQFSLLNTYPTCLSFLPNSDTLVSGDLNGNIRLWSNQEITNFCFNQHAQPAGVTALAITPDGSYVAYATRDAMVYFVELETQKLIRSMQTESIVYALAFALTEQVLALSTEKSVILWDVIANQSSCRFNENEGRIGALAWMRDSLLVGLSTGVIRMLVYKKDPAQQTDN